MRPLAPLRARERAIRTPALPITDPDPREALAAAIWARAMPAPAASTWRGACDAGHPRVGGEHGAARYAEFCEAADKAGTEFVMQAATFLGPERHYLEPWTRPLSKAEALLDCNRRHGIDFIEGKDDD